jgi:hypothetical protein
MIYNNSIKAHVSPEVIVNGNRVQIMIRSAGVAGAVEDAEDEGVAPNPAPYEYFEQLDPGSPEQENFIDDAVSFLKQTKKVKNKKYAPILLTNNAITLSDQIQLIIRFYGDPEEIHKNYDFVHCTNYWDSATNKLYLNQPALESIISKTLVYQGSLYPLCSLFRLRKFIQRGWTINAGQILKIALNLQQFDLNNHMVLQDQLMGGDIAYFAELLCKINSTNIVDTDIDYIYICRLIDEIF